MNSLIDRTNIEGQGGEANFTAKNPGLDSDFFFLYMFQYEEWCVWGARLGLSGEGGEEAGGDSTISSIGMS